MHIVQSKKWSLLVQFELCLKLLLLVHQIFYINLQNINNICITRKIKLKKKKVCVDFNRNNQILWDGTTRGEQGYQRSFIFLGAEWLKMYNYIKI